MFTIDFTKPWLYKDTTCFNQGNLSVNNIRRCKLVTGGNDDLTDCNVICNFIVGGVETKCNCNIVDPLNGIIDIVFPKEALTVGVNHLEIFIKTPNGGAAQSPSLEYKVWQGLTNSEIRFD